MSELSRVWLTVDGAAVQVPRGSTLLEAVRRGGSELPALCDSPGRACRAVCRLCLVEVQGLRGLITACSTPAGEGMIVSTRGERLLRVRQTLLELMLAEHGLCYRPDCEVEGVARSFGVTRTAYCGPPGPRSTCSSDYLLFRGEACVHCDRCIRACGERAVLQRCGRGAGVSLAFGEGEQVGESPCVYCGDCIAACPSGSLSAAAELHGPFLNRQPGADADGHAGPPREPGQSGRASPGFQRSESPPA